MAWNPRDGNLAARAFEALCSVPILFEDPVVRVGGGFSAVELETCFGIGKFVCHLNVSVKMVNVFQVWQVILPNLPNLLLFRLSWRGE